MQVSFLRDGYLVSARSLSLTRWNAGEAVEEVVHVCLHLPDQHCHDSRMSSLAGETARAACGRWRLPSRKMVVGDVRALREGWGNGTSRLSPFDCHDSAIG
jgi:hypothetical protein